MTETIAIFSQCILGVLAIPMTILFILSVISWIFTPRLIRSNKLATVATIMVCLAELFIAFVYFFQFRVK